MATSAASATLTKQPKLLTQPRWLVRRFVAKTSGVDIVIQVDALLTNKTPNVSATERVILSLDKEFLGPGAFMTLAASSS